ncbi:MAG: bifunctional (p)ppGpp synthetase/guanosine-3',5'-bis(diphosphate) 3'-pyrophosphohydrolase [Planctomycetes bacterium]|nr:bifunctional (p)ppGpp synthetase/guanosine-3',5'-bis(diphosphate) 3'-pyrophosphohydrolase [Planctomycetota bacterium]
MPWSPDLWHAAWEFASRAHHGQSLPGSDLPYAGHVAAVAMELARALALRELAGNPVAQPDLAIACALLHDVVEDTAVGLDEIAARFGAEVADGVAALTKNAAAGDKPAQMADSLRRIRQGPPEVWMVKLADRIHNLREPPAYWTLEKRRAYRAEAERIHAELAEACPILAARLRERIAAYPIEPAV